MNCEALLEVAALIAARVQPLLADAREMASAGRVTDVKPEDHLVHQIDHIADAALLEGLRAVGFAGRLFSEESGWSDFGEADDIVVCDPFCNTTPTFRGIRESAIALTMWREGVLVAGVVVDLQVARAVVVKGRGVDVLSFPVGPSFRSVATVHPVPASLEDAHMVFSLYKRKRRLRVSPALLSAPATMQVLDGAINVVRLVSGDSDVFVDLVGQPLYEALPYAAVVLNGGSVLALSGEPLDFRAAVSALESEEVVGRIPLVAARSEGLAREVLRLVSQG